MTQAKTVKRLELLEQAIARAVGGRGVVCLFSIPSESAEQREERIREAIAQGYDKIITVIFVKPDDWPGELPNT